MLFFNGLSVDFMSKFEANIERDREKEVEHMSTLFLQLTQVVMLRIAVMVSLFLNVSLFPVFILTLAYMIFQEILSCNFFCS